MYALETDFWTNFFKVLEQNGQYASVMRHFCVRRPHRGHFGQDLRGVERARDAQEQQESGRRPRIPVRLRAEGERGCELGAISGDAEKVVHVDHAFGEYGFAVLHEQ